MLRSLWPCSPRSSSPAAGPWARRPVGPSKWRQGVPPRHPRRSRGASARAGVQRRNHSHSERGSDRHDRRYEREQLPPRVRQRDIHDDPRRGRCEVRGQTHVVNNAKTSLDLTCSLPVNTKLVDDQERQFDPIDDLYKLKGNPECNDQLQPGFESDMTWLYRVPSTANVVGWAFQDLTDFAAPPPQWTAVRLQI